jgi:hypothetical protein
MVACNNIEKNNLLKKSVSFKNDDTQAVLSPASKSQVSSHVEYMKKRFYSFQSFRKETFKLPNGRLISVTELERYQYSTSNNMK